MRPETFDMGDTLVSLGCSDRCNPLHYYITKNLRISDKIDTNDSQGRPKLQHTASSQKVVRERLSNEPTLQHPIYTWNFIFIT